MLHLIPMTYWRREVWRPVKARCQWRITGRNFRVASGITADSGNVFGRKVNTCAAYMQGLQCFCLEIISQWDVLEFQERAVFHIEWTVFIGTLRPGSRYVAGGVFRSPAVSIGSKHIGILFGSRVFEHHAVGIENIIAIAPLEEDVQVEVFPNQIIGKTTYVFGLTVTDSGLVLIVDFAFTCQVTVFGVSRLSTGYVIRDAFFKVYTSLPFSSIVLLKSSYL